MQFKKFLRSLFNAKAYPVESTAIKKPEIMVNPTDFQLSTEDLFQLRVYRDELDRCDNVEQLRNMVIETMRLQMVYKTLLGNLLKGVEK